MSLKTGYNVESVPVMASINGRFYITNDFDRLQVWDGIATTTRDAGIASPAAAPAAPAQAAGTCTTGTHLVRYRYLDSTSPASTYRSNASPALTVTVSSAANAKLTFSVGASGNIVSSTDAKADTIQIEMTLASGSVYYVVTTIANTATTVDVNIADSLLTLNEQGGLYDTNISTSTDYGGGHEQPPIGALVAQCKNRTFIAGSFTRTRTVGVTLSSNSVTGTNFSSLWSGRMLQVSGDAVAYQISSATSTTLTLSTNYAGSTNAAASATISSRTPNRLYWSAAANGAQLPESWKLSQLGRDVLNGSGDVITGLINWRGDLLIAGKFSMERLIFVDDPAVNGELVSIAGKFGVWNQRCFVVVDDRLFGWGPNGLWEMRAGGPAWISRPIDTTLYASTAAYCDITKSAQFHGVYDPTEKCIRWFFPTTGETTPRQAICLDLVGRRWSRAKWRQGIDASCNVVNTNGSYLAVLSDSTNGYTWYHRGATDGVPSTSTGDYTVSTGSTTTVVNVTGSSLPTPNGLAGVMLYVPATGEERVITSNTSSAITLGTALSVAPSNGAKVYAGQIPCILETGWWDGPDDTTADKMRSHLYVEFMPSTAGAIRIRLYRDWSTTPATWTTQGGTMTPPHGVIQWANGQTYVDCYMDSTNSSGFIKIPMFMEWARVLKASVEAISPAGTFRLVNVYFSPRRSETRDATNE